MIFIELKCSKSQDWLAAQGSVGLCHPENSELEPGTSLT